MSCAVGGSAAPASTRSTAASSAGRCRPLPLPRAAAGAACGAVAWSAARAPGRLAACRRRERARVTTAASSASAAAELRAQGLQLDAFDAAALQQAVTQLRAQLGAAGAGADDATLAWFLRDRKLNVAAAAAKLEGYLTWRAAGNAGAALTDADVAAEAAGGKAVLLPFCDVLGRPVVRVRVARNRTDERDLRATERLCVALLDVAVTRMQAGGESETVMAIFDMRGFGLANADLPFIRFFIRVMFDYYPKRISQVLLVDAPLAFQPMWQVVKPLLGKYAGLVRFVKAAEVARYFAPGDDALAVEVSST